MRFYDEPYISRQSPTQAGLTREGGAAERATHDVYDGWSDTQLATTCWLCGKNGMKDPLDKHHIFGGAYRKKSEKYGLTVPLCHKECHQFGKYAAHQNAETMQRLHEYGQRKAMKEQGWTVRKFALEFGRNYLDVSPEDWDLTIEEIDRRRTMPHSEKRRGESPVTGFIILEATPLPF